MREMHARLLASGRGKAMMPGEFRRSQNWIDGSRPGNAAFVPPPSNHVQACMADLERFIHDANDGLPVPVKAGLAHVQFETIHPFLDGNGRVGRMLITLMLCDAGLLREPRGRARGDGPPARQNLFTHERYLAVLREGTEDPPG